MNTDMWCPNCQQNVRPKSHDLRVSVGMGVLLLIVVYGLSQVGISLFGLDRVRWYEAFGIGAGGWFLLFSLFEGAARKHGFSLVGAECPICHTDNLEPPRTRVASPAVPSVQHMTSPSAPHTISFSTGASSNDEGNSGDVGLGLVGISQAESDTDTR